MNKDNEEIDANNDIFNYKGYFVENANENDEPKYFEYGAHFRYKDLYNALKIIKQKKLRQIMEQKEEKKLSQPKEKKLENRERNNTKNNNKNKNLTLENNIQTILKGFKSRIRSRNIGVDEQNDNQNELTFVIRNKNNFSVKKDEKNNNYLYGNKTNFTKVNNNNIKKSVNKNYNNSNNNYLNKKINIKDNHEKNNNISTSKKFQKNKSNLDKNKLSNKNILSRNQEQNNLYQQVQIPSSNKTKNHHNLNMNFYQSYKTQISKLNNNGAKIKLFNFDESSLNSHSKEIDDIKKFYYVPKNNQKIIQKNNSNLTEPKLVYSSLNKNISNSKNKNLKLDKIENNNLNNEIIKKNNNKATGKTASFNLDKVIKDTLLKGYKSKNSKFSPKKNQNKIIPTDSGKFSSKNNYSVLTRKQKDISNISLNKNKLNEYSDYIDNKAVISVSMDNNKKYLSNNITIEKLKNKGKNDNKNIVQISLFNHSNNNNSNCTTFPDLMNKNKNYGKNFLSSNQNCENIKLKSNKSKKEESINNNQMTKNKNNSHSNKNNDVFNLLDKNEIHSRNKNSNYFLNNISSINFTNKKTINTSCNNKNMKNNFSNINNIKKINITLQNNKLIRFKNHKIQIRNKMLNVKKNANNSNKNNNNKKDKIEISSTSKKKLFTTSNEENYPLNNNYKTELFNKRFNFNNLVINKSKKRVNLTKNVIHRTITKENTFIKTKNINKSSNNDMNPNKSDASNNVYLLNDIKNNSWGIKKYETFIKKKSKKNNININININNNNKIIYNKIVENKTNGSKNISKAVKSPSLQKIKSYVNNSKYEVKSKNMVNNDKKIKFINIQFPKAKFLNLYSSNNNK